MIPGCMTRCIMPRQIQLLAAEPFVGQSLFNSDEDWLHWATQPRFSVLGLQVISAQFT